MDQFPNSNLPSDAQRYNDNDARENFQMQLLLVREAEQERKKQFLLPRQEQEENREGTVPLDEMQWALPRKQGEENRTIQRGEQRLHATKMPGIGKKMPDSYQMQLAVVSARRAQEEHRKHRECTMHRDQIPIEHSEGGVPGNRLEVGEESFDDNLPQRKRLRVSPDRPIEGPSKVPGASVEVTSGLNQGNGPSLWKSPSIDTTQSSSSSVPKPSSTTTQKPLFSSPTTSSNLPTSKPALFDRSSMQRRYEQLRTRHQQIIEANTQVRAELTNVDTILESMLDSGEMHGAMYDRLLELSEKISCAKGMLR